MADIVDTAKKIQHSPPLLGLIIGSFLAINFSRFLQISTATKVCFGDISDQEGICDSNLCAQCVRVIQTK